MNMNIKWIIPLIIITLVLLVLIAPSQAVLLTPVDFLHCENEWFNTTTNKDFNVIKVAATYVVFNYTGFNLSSSHNVYVYVDYIRPNIPGAAAGEYVLRYYENTSMPTRIWMNISGMVVHNFYNVTRDGVFVQNLKANASGSISWSEFVTGKHYFQIYKAVNATPAGFVPTVSTNYSSGIKTYGFTWDDTSNATLHGYITANGSSAVLTSGFQYGLTSALGTYSSGISSYTYEHNAPKNTMYVTNTNLWYGQGFRIAYNGTNTSYSISGVNVNIGRDPGEAPGTITLRLYAANASWGPTGAILATGSINGNIIATSSVWKPINFTTPYVVHPGERYVWTIGGACPGANWFYIAANTHSLYPSFRYFSTDNGTTYHISSGAATTDFGFDIIGHASKVIQHNLTGLSSGKLYFYRAFANNSNGTGLGTTLKFLTKPSAPTIIYPYSNSSTQAFFDIWKGTGANNTVIRAKRGGYPSSLADGIAIVNGTTVHMTSNILNSGVYYISGWSWAKQDGLNNYSDVPAQNVFMVRPVNATTLTPTKVAHGVNITWITAGAKNASILVRNGHHYPQTFNDGDLIYNGTHNCYVDTTIAHCNGSVAYYRVWTWASWISGGIATERSNNNESLKFIYSNQTVYPLNVTNLEETTVTFNGIYYGGTSAVCGFWIQYTDPVTELTMTSNVTANGGIAVTLNQTFSVSLAVLPAKYHYIRAWSINQSSPPNRVNHSITEQYFLTKPNPPSNLKVTHPGGVCTISWVNASIPASTPINTTVIRYRTGSPPTSVTDGLGCNVTSNHTTIPGLFGVYYFSIWHYIKDSGSPTFHWYSDTYLWTMATLEGGRYNLTIRYENTTYKRVNLSRGGNHTLIVHYTNKTEFNRFMGRTWRYRESTFVWSDPKNGSFTINCSQTPIFFEFHWNDTRNDSSTYAYRCNRIIVPAAYQYNRTIYILTNKMVYGDYTTTINNSIVRYTYSFQDKSGIFDSRLNLNSYASIYTYDMNNTKLIIHEEFLDSTSQIYPWLLYEKRYFIGIACSVAAIERIGVAPTSSALNPQVIIPLLTDHYYSLNEIIVVTAGWNNVPPGCWIRYQDTVFKTNNISLRIYNMTTGARVYWHNVSTFLFNFSCPTGNKHQTYNFILTINHTYWALNQTITGILYPYSFPSHNGSWLNYIMNLTFGKTPIRNEDTGQELPWIYILIGAVAFFILLSFSTINAFGAVAGAGLWLVFSGTFFSNLPEVGMLGAAALIVGGFFMVILAIIAAMGGYGR